MLTLPRLIPARRSFQLLGLNLVLALGASFLPLLLPLWQMVLAASALLWLLDALLICVIPASGWSASCRNRCRWACERRCNC
ncbi:MAG: hypothetical protein R3E89_16130 [Thiolinea sp.]